LPAVFVDPIAALHGDIGVLSPHGIDVALMISYSGRTAELLRLLPTLQARCQGGLIALTGDPTASLSVAADCWLDGMVDGEADAEVPAPSSSALVALAQLDALALCSLRLRVGWEAPGTARASVFAHHHEGGQLGIKLKNLV
jgi:D-arabinose 5-phosphate isomerase GutQ